MLQELVRSVNLRDLGGVTNIDGDLVRTGRVYRSGALTDLAGHQLAAVRALGIHTIVDLRRNAERQSCPTPWQAMGCADYWYRNYDEDDADHRERMHRPDYTADDSRAWMLALYADLPYSHAESYRRLFRAIADGEGPVLFHCAVGKDRTGGAAALILAAAGVDRPAIVADYVATADYDLLGSPHFKGVALRSDKAAVFAPLMHTDPTYIDVMFDAILKRSGSIERYLADVLGLDARQLASLRDQLLVAS